VYDYVLLHWANSLVIWVGSSCSFLVQHQFTDVMANISMTLIALLLQVISIYFFGPHPYCVWRVFQKADHWQEVIATVFLFVCLFVCFDQMHMSFPQIIIWSQSLSKDLFILLLLFGDSITFLNYSECVECALLILFFQEWVFELTMCFLSFSCKLFFKEVDTSEMNTQSCCFNPILLIFVLLCNAKWDVRQNEQHFGWKEMRRKMQSKWFVAETDWFESRNS